MTVWIPLLVAIIGLLVYALSSNGKVAEAGRLLFFAGSLVTLFALTGHSLRLV